MSRTLMIRVGKVEQARRELKADIETLAGGARVRRPREIWFASLAHAASILTDQRLGLLRVIHQERPGSIPQLARLARRGVKAVEADVQVLADVGLVKLLRTRVGRRPVAGYGRIHLAGDIPLARAAA